MASWPRPSAWRQAIGQEGAQRNLGPGSHILSSWTIKVEFPCLGKLVTSRSGRIEFVFDALFAEHFESDRYGLIKEMPFSPADYEVALQGMGLYDGAAPRASSSRGAGGAPARAGVTRRAVRPDGAPYSRALTELLALCRVADRTVAGCVPRLRMESWLNTTCKAVLTHISAAALMDLLDRFTYGKNSKQIMYGQFLDALDDTLGASTQYAAPPPLVMNAPHASAPAEGAHDEAVGTASHPGGFGRVAWEEHEEDEEEQADRGYPSRYQGAGATAAEASASDVVVHHAYPPLPPGSPPGAPLQQVVNHAVAHMAGAGQQGQQQQPRPVATPDTYLHYCQNQLSPRSRSEYDAFNRAHFSHLDATRGRRNGGTGAHRAVTPKVGSEPLNVSEYEAVRSASPLRQRPPPPAAPWAGSASPGADRAVTSPLAAWMPVRVPAPPPVSVAARYMPHAPQVLEILHASERAHQPSPPLAARPPGPGHAQSYDILAPPPAVAPPKPAAPRPLSQYEIAREEDPDVRAHLKARYAAALDEMWGRQIRQKEELEAVLHTKEGVWPFGPVHVPMDKRPPSAISKPPASSLSPRRHHHAY
ncbi:hypothetical protein FOA52_005300 [Chlamydomonas sp. UWO 241]|nr:hypothetical protein FOA52_005300 [Chlamydomonas sp. UWO 241]